VACSREAGRDHLWLTELETKSLMPDAPEVGSREQVAAPIVDRICRRYLIDLVRVGGNGGPRRPEDVIREQLQVIVASVSAMKYDCDLTVPHD
jgi:hypothetical protein